MKDVLQILHCSLLNFLDGKRYLFQNNGLAGQYYFYGPSRFLDTYLKVLSLINVTLFVLAHLYFFGRNPSATRGGHC